MKPDTIAMIRDCVPEIMPLTYYADRESAWCLANMMPAEDTVPALRKSRLGRFLDRPILKPLVASCGGTLRRADVRALAQAGDGLRMTGVTQGGYTALEGVFATAWDDYVLTLTKWGDTYRWPDAQTSLRGLNLVLQVGFPAAHAELLNRVGLKANRKQFEVSHHPIRTDGAPTLSWARLEVDLESGEALIEEVQSDWLRRVRRHCDRESKRAPRSRALRVLQSYEADLTARYGKLWPKVTLLAALLFLKEELGCTRIWMHQPGPGVALKQIKGPAPPVSLYSALPKSFGFTPTDEVPPFLKPARRKTLRDLRKRHDTLFWRMDL
ncbi:hypothetical protein AADZ90_006370 [Aestuariibius sp. 2305UL40-4]|uniref:hypothetical protein n=1 Tax=Aestuariibius violaceus TaxID=3234132 RepID=UPI00345E83CB